MSMFVTVNIDSADSPAEKEQEALCADKYCSGFS